MTKPKMDPFGRPIEDGGIGVIPGGGLDLVTPQQMAERVMERDAEERLWNDEDEGDPVTEMELDDLDESLDLEPEE